MVMSVCITFDTVSPYLRIYLKEIIVDMGKMRTEGCSLKHHP